LGASVKVDLPVNIRDGKMADIKALLEYNGQVRRRYFDVLCKLPWEEVTKNREASFGSMRNIFVHTLSCVDYWLDFLQNQKLYSCKEYDHYNSCEQIRGYLEQVEKRTKGYLSSLPETDLQKIYVAQDDAKHPVTVTAEDILIHLFEEEIHHRGELIALMWQMNVEPPLMSWNGL
jgi:uncharacterized damage-inducible protein DinB